MFQSCQMFNVTSLRLTKVMLNCLVFKVRCGQTIWTFFLTHVPCCFLGSLLCLLLIGVATLWQAVSVKLHLQRINQCIPMWFQSIWKIFVNLDHFPRDPGWTKNIWNYHLVNVFLIQGAPNCWNNCIQWIQQGVAKATSSFAHFVKSLGGLNSCLRPQA